MGFVTADNFQQHWCHENVIIVTFRSLSIGTKKIEDWEQT